MRWPLKASITALFIIVVGFIFHAFFLKREMNFAEKIEFYRSGKAHVPSTFVSEAFSFLSNLEQSDVKRNPPESIFVKLIEVVVGMRSQETISRPLFSRLMHDISVACIHAFNDEIGDCIVKSVDANWKFGSLQRVERLFTDRLINIVEEREPSLDQFEYNIWSSCLQVGSVRCIQSFLIRYKDAKLSSSKEYLVAMSRIVLNEPHEEVLQYYKNKKNKDFNDFQILSTILYLWHKLWNL